MYVHAVATVTQNKISQNLMSMKIFNYFAFSNVQTFMVLHFYKAVKLLCSYVVSDISYISSVAEC